MWLLTSAACSLRNADLTRDDVVSNKAVYLDLGIQPDGQRDVRDLWVEEIEGGELWLF